MDSYPPNHKPQRGQIFEGYKISKNIFKQSEEGSDYFFQHQDD